MKFQAQKRKGKPIVTGVLLLLAIAMVAFSVTSNPMDMTLLTATVNTSSGLNGCTPGSFAPKSEVVISKSAIASTETSRLDLLKQFTKIQYERHMMNLPGKEHYALLHYLVKNYGDYRHITDA